MLKNLADGADHIYIACGFTDFRKQIESLSALVSLKFNLDPFTPKCLFIFCNKSKNSIKVLQWDNDGFILVTKKLVEKMKFQWLKDSEGVKDISPRELRWLLEGLSIDQPKAHKNITVNDDICF
ncbi:IS66 family insertion sequence element accessory protein TnpB [Clostridium botulinum]|uniref:IS66 family insertion sequence element accessory protein TnpB n=1 Tax=Clostridium botulinum TaxID=1491 RepID=UPI001FD6764B|nr:IS66 family insertion sequence element accessory protein TnpB [Clostridium botulinum]MCJ8174461.1 IS66 family insertion sequence element accessory protein TnpB [Clostridium botulinum]